MRSPGRSVDVRCRALRTGPVGPPPKVALLSLLAVTALADTLFLAVLGSGDAAVAWGLATDVVGAVLLAVPDVPVLWRLHYGGRLEHAVTRFRRTYALDRLHARSSVEGIGSFGRSATLGFEEFVDTARDHRDWLDQFGIDAPNDHIPWEELTTVRLSEGAMDEAFVKDAIDDEAAFDPSVVGRFEYYVFEIGGGDVAFTASADSLHEFVDRRLDHLRSRTRRLGLAVLVLGFLNQLVGTAFAVL